MFKFINPRLEIANNRIHDLELSNERLISQIQVLQESLTNEQNNNSHLLNKIFDLTGINKNENKQVTVPSNKPIQIGGQRLNWPAARQTLEQKSVEEHFKRTYKTVDPNEIKDLETEIGIEEDASKIS